MNVLRWLHPDISGQRGVCSVQSCINTGVAVDMITFTVFNSFVRIQRNHTQTAEVNLTCNLYCTRTVQRRDRFTLQPFWPEIAVSAQALCWYRIGLGWWLGLLVQGRCSATLKGADGQPISIIKVMLTCDFLSMWPVWKGSVVVVMKERLLL